MVCLLLFQIHANPSVGWSHFAQIKPEGQKSRDLACVDAQVTMLCMSELEGGIHVVYVKVENGQWTVGRC